MQVESAEQALCWPGKSGTRQNKSHKNHATCWIMFFDPGVPPKHACSVEWKTAKAMSKAIHYGAPDGREGVVTWQVLFLLRLYGPKGT